MNWTFSSAQVHTPVKWNFSVVPTSDGGDALLMFRASLDDGWHVYSQFISNEGPLPTTFTFPPNSDYSLVGKVREEGNALKSYDSTFMMDVIWFAGSVTFVQKVKLHVPSTVVKGKIEFMACTDEMCLPPDELPFSLEVSANKSDKKKTNEKTVAPQEKTKDNPESSKENPYRDSALAQIQEAHTATITDSSRAVIVQNNVPPTDEINEAVTKQSLAAIFLAGFLGGLAAFFMPCIFPLLPMTVGYFAKRENSGKAIRVPLIYGASIVVLYVGIGMLITILFGSDALNDLSTNGIFNFFFFLLLIVFAASFLGAMELALPSSWVNKADALADRGGPTGIFFMAMTLALVSFSCTGPIIGTLLVQTASMNVYSGPAVGMFGFSFALALPFTLFSMFPAWLTSLPKSGTWLNSFKVTLGFLELALALKFLSNVDLAYHWDWFDREVFLVLWIIIFGLLGFYLLGKLRLSAHDKLRHLSVPRLFLAIFTLAFTLYLIPGLWGAPLKAVSAFLPPQHSQDFDLYTVSFASNEVLSPPEEVVRTEGVTRRVKYSNLFHSPLNLPAFFDFEEALSFARHARKPLLIDFTGHACVNCRKMETVVWSDPRIYNRIKHDYILVQLYVDDKTALPENEQFTSSYSGKEIKTIGNKWSDFQASIYNSNSQPFYVLLDPDGKQLSSPSGAEYDVENFKKFLDNGLYEFNTR